MRDHPAIRRGEGDGPEPETCETCEGTGRVTLGPWCDTCGSDDTVALLGPCPDDPAGHVLETYTETCLDCEGSGAAPDRDPDDDDRDPYWQPGPGDDR